MARVCDICRALKREMFALEQELVAVLGSNGGLYPAHIWAHIETLTRDLLTAQTLFVQHQTRCPGRIQ